MKDPNKYQIIRDHGYTGHRVIRLINKATGVTERTLRPRENGNTNVFVPNFDGVAWELCERFDDLYYIENDATTHAILNA